MGLLKFFRTTQKDYIEVSADNPLPVEVSGGISLDAGDLEIGAVELKDASTDTRTKISASTSIAEADNALAVKDAVNGVTTGTAVVTDSAGTHQQYLRGIIKIFADIWNVTAHGFRTILTNSSGTEIGTNAAPVRVDPTGITAQPITDNGGSLTVDSGQLPAALSGSGNLKTVVSESLPAGSATIGGVNVVNIASTAAASMIDDRTPGISLNTQCFNYGFDGTDWDRLRVDNNKNLKVTSEYSYSHISTNTTTTVKSGAGVLRSISINTKGASSNIATIYDNTAGSGTVIGVIDTTDRTVTLKFDVIFSTGLTIVTATGTAADITVSYR